MNKELCWSLQDLLDAGLKETSLYEYLSTQGLNFIDVGAKDGVVDAVKGLSSFLNALLFEPNKDEYQKIANDHPFKSQELFNVGLGAKNQEQNLYITESSMCCSIFKPNEFNTKRYGLYGYKVKAVESIQLTTLDALNIASDSSYILKLDAQGAELDIIRGGQNFIEHNVTAIISEVNFIESYDNIPLFSEIELALRKLGFTFVTYTDFMYRSNNKNKSHGLSRERLFHADALFIKDPIINEQKDISQCYQLITLYVLYNLYDLALELVDHLELDNIDKHQLIIFINNCRKKYLQKNIELTEKNLALLKDEVQNNKQVEYYLNLRSIL
ncbi:FkbM family methyltransferase [Rickettsiales endosymbiont of Stachyamoeba lipophora]|uniref:FkbM family methyltransferase n=1 Tax=Rickettsiales endosymbiont of Stachyamoeba lipophora TaxID=2486578 RepID=UPI000F6517E2|nr:FkbM family methyltransferase [Rickettsiales endosymbiont of Stachyamoeba lipophora]AZL15699.1 FkbM family methyltransferase [Rickettsiales endosymbiont of Stachyamoeba lipophora]